MRVTTLMIYHKKTSANVTEVFYFIKVYLAEVISGDDQRHRTHYP